MKTINSEANVLLANYLENQRLNKGLSRSKLGHLISVTHTVIKQIERHERRIDLIELVRYSNALDVNPADVLQIVITAESDQDKTDAGLT